jgi:hypothetical protein
MSRLKQPLRVWHGLLAIVAAIAVGAGGTAIAGGGGQAKNLPLAGFGPGSFVNSGKYHYGFKVTGTPTGDSQRRLRLRCPRGTRVIAGGGGGLSTDPLEQNVNFSVPFDTRDRGRAPEDGWITYVNSVDSEGESIAVAATCVDKR